MSQNTPYDPFALSPLTLSLSLLFIDQILSNLSREISEILEKRITFITDVITFKENFVKANRGFKRAGRSFERLPSTG
jgi:hypothetical protein